MSAYICENATINRIITGIDLRYRRDSNPQMLLAELGYNLATDTGKQKLGQHMRGLNMAAVGQRYPDTVGNPDNRPGKIGETSMDSYKYRVELTGTYLQTLKSLRCWLYQCTEGSAPEHELYKTLDEIANILALEIVSRLPAYEKAKWG